MHEWNPRRNSNNLETGVQKDPNSHEREGVYRIKISTSTPLSKSFQEKILNDKFISLGQTSLSYSKTNTKAFKVSAYRPGEITTKSK